MIYHLTTHTIWQKTLDSNKGFYKHPSLESEGFIHCSFQEQVAESANLHFPEEEELVILYIVERRIKELVKSEASRKGELFPHVYGPMPLEAIEEVRILMRNSEGKFEF
jgi:uncharacterized protein (DUF952 family)